MSVIFHLAASRSDLVIGDLALELFDTAGDPLASSPTLALISGFDYALTLPDPPGSGRYSVTFRIDNVTNGFSYPSHQVPTAIVFPRRRIGEALPTALFLRNGADTGQVVTLAKTASGDVKASGWTTGAVADSESVRLLYPTGAVWSEGWIIPAPAAGGNVFALGEVVAEIVVC